MAMELKDFTALKEIQSLDNLIKKHLDAIESEESRKESVLKMRSKRESEKVGLLSKTEENTALISQFEKELHDWEKKRRQGEINQERARDQKQAQALEKEINQITPKCEELEDKVLSLLEKDQEFKIEIEEINTFLAGSLDTLKGIEKEIAEETQEEKRHIENYEKRIESLIEEISPELKDSFYRARIKYRFKSPLARIINKSCEKCGYQVDSQTLSLVDQAKTVSLCGQCERLLIPFDA